MRELKNIYDCACGKVHECDLELVTGNGAIKKVPELLKKRGLSKPFVVADKNTYKAAGEKLLAILKDAGISYVLYVYEKEVIKPEEESCGSLLLHFDNTCDSVIGVGSGVINDCCKIFSSAAHLPYLILATAPSVDGYASYSGSMEVDGLKTTVPAKYPEMVVGDTDILKNAPLPMLKSGLGDMIAKYVGLTEWRLSALINDEYFCPVIYDMMSEALETCMKNAEGLVRREDEAVQVVFEGLVLAGVAMTYAGATRPASGGEHYFSHIWDMRGLEFGTKVDMHGTQASLGTILSLGLYEQLAKITPDREKALNYVANYDKEAWFERLTALVGTGAKSMIRNEARDGKYDPEKHKKRLEVILEHWDEIVAIINDLPKQADIIALLRSIDAPVSPEELGIPSDLSEVFLATKDIRDKYVLSRLAWDLGVIDELAEKLKPENRKAV